MREIDSIENYLSNSTNSKLYLSAAVDEALDNKVLVRGPSPGSREDMLMSNNSDILRKYISKLRKYKALYDSKRNDISNMRIY